MTTVHRVTAAAVAFPLALLAGCGGGPKYAPVSGVVKLDGKPYADAVVVFRPMPAGNNQDAPGPTSSSYTDENGRFVLKSQMDDSTGALVGKHQVMIMTKGNDVTGYDPTTGSPDGEPGAAAKGRIDPIPDEWNSKSTKTFDVPAGGTDQANFDITSIKGARKK